MQARGRRRHGAALARIHGLVPIDVRRGIRTSHVRRERDVAKSLYGLVDGQRSPEAHDACPAVGDALDLDREVWRDHDGSAGAKLAARVYQRFVAFVANGSQQHDLGRRA